MVVQILGFTSYNINVASSNDGPLHLLGLSMLVRIQNIHHQKLVSEGSYWIQ